MHNLSYNIGKVDYLYFSENFFAFVRLHTCLNIILVFYITEHANLPIYSADKFAHRRIARNDGHACAQRLVNKQQFYQTSMLKFIGVTLGK